MLYPFQERQARKQHFRISILYSNVIYVQKNHANDSIHLLQVWRRPLPHIIVAFHTIYLTTIINIPPGCHNIQLLVRMNSLLVLLGGVSTKVSVFNSGIQSLGNVSGNSNHGFVMLHIDQSECCYSVFTCYHCSLLLSQCHSFLAAFFEVSTVYQNWHQLWEPKALLPKLLRWMTEHGGPVDGGAILYHLRCMYNPVYFGDNIYNGINCQSTGAGIQPSIVGPNVHLMEGLSFFQLKNWRELRMFQLGWESDCNLDIG